MHADLFGLFKSNFGNSHLLCTTNAFTKIVVVVPTPDREATTVATSILLHWIRCNNQYRNWHCHQIRHRTQWNQMGQETGTTSLGLSAPIQTTSSTWTTSRDNSNTIQDHSYLNTGYHDSQQSDGGKLAAPSTNGTGRTSSHPDPTNVGQRVVSSGETVTRRQQRSKQPHLSSQH